MAAKQRPTALSMGIGGANPNPAAHNGDPRTPLFRGTRSPPPSMVVNRGGAPDAEDVETYVNRLANIAVDATKSAFSFIHGLVSPRSAQPHDHDQHGAPDGPSTSQSGAVSPSRKDSSIRPQGGPTPRSELVSPQRARGEKEEDALPLFRRVSSAVVAPRVPLTPVQPVRPLARVPTAAPPMSPRQPAPLQPPGQGGAVGAGEEGNKSITDARQPRAASTAGGSQQQVYHFHYNFHYLNGSHSVPPGESRDVVSPYGAVPRRPFVSASPHRLSGRQTNPLGGPTVSVPAWDSAPTWRPVIASARPLFSAETVGRKRGLDVESDGDAHTPGPAPAAASRGPPAKLQRTETGRSELQHATPRPATGVVDFRSSDPDKRTERGPLGPSNKPPAPAAPLPAQVPSTQPSKTMSFVRPGPPAEIKDDSSFAPNAGSDDEADEGPKAPPSSSPAKAAFGGSRSPFDFGAKPETGDPTKPAAPAPSPFSFGGASSAPPVAAFPTKAPAPAAPPPAQVPSTQPSKTMSFVRPGPPAEIKDDSSFAPNAGSDDEADEGPKAPPSSSPAKAAFGGSRSPFDFGAKPETGDPTKPAAPAPSPFSFGGASSAPPVAAFPTKAPAPAAPLPAQVPSTQPSKTMGFVRPGPPAEIKDDSSFAPNAGSDDEADEGESKTPAGSPASQSPFWGGSSGSSIFTTNGGNGNPPAAPLPALTPAAGAAGFLVPNVSFALVPMAAAGPRPPLVEEAPDSPATGSLRGEEVAGFGFAKQGAPPPTSPFDLTASSAKSRPPAPITSFGLATAGAPSPFGGGIQFANNTKPSPFS